MGRKIEQAFKSLLGKSGYSSKASNEVWKWYNPRKGKSSTTSSDFWALYDSIYEKGPAIRYSNPEKWRQP